MATLYDIVPKDILVTSTFDEHKFVKKFNESSDNDDDLKNTLINAYMVRDVHYNGKKTLTQLMEGHCSKLMLHLSEEDKKKRREYQFISNIKEMVNRQTFIDNKIQDYYNSVINRQDTEAEIANEQKYQKIMQMIDEGKSFEEIYNEFTVEELGYLGW